jgi:hypothetical protein
MPWLLPDGFRTAGGNARVPARRSWPHQLIRSVPVALGLGLSACASAGDTTCADLGEMDSVEVAMTLRDLLVHHDLDPDSTSNMLGLTDAVQTFCGGSAVIGGDAAGNHDRPLDDAVDWASPTW